ncbi:uncharacterized protein LOC141898726 [Tubulanus polymorphus]|uniref:uncharacterized protein LOC141898726 n=1 Tax=Tubulanus polymorphus TaxID=672921 RepID=UPI003DA3A7C3
MDFSLLVILIMFSSVESSTKLGNVSIYMNATSAYDGDSVQITCRRNNICNNETGPFLLRHKRPGTTLFETVAEACVPPFQQTVEMELCDVDVGILSVRISQADYNYVGYWRCQFWNTWPDDLKIVTKPAPTSASLVTQQTSIASLMKDRYFDKLVYSIITMGSVIVLLIISNIYACTICCIYRRKYRHLRSRRRRIHSADDKLRSDNHRSTIYAHTLDEPYDNIDELTKNISDQNEPRQDDDTEYIKMDGTNLSE